MVPLDGHAVLAGDDRDGDGTAALMLCSRCHTKNREGRRFCGECGLSFVSTCPSCGFLNEGGEKFCGGCGRSLMATASPVEPRFSSPKMYTPGHLAEKILTSKSALEGERKQVTVLFADLKGSMELLADRDPEEARKILDPVLERMMEAVHHYEGTVNQVMGDGVMALFGAPLAQEDHAVRACYAALRMQESVKRYGEEVRRTEGVLIQIRVGLNSGDVVVRSIGSDLRMDYTAVGQTTHLAARMEQVATPGSILLAPETFALAEGFVQTAPLGPIGVKGLPSPINVFELTGASPFHSRLQAAAARGLTRFVGRDTEIGLLRQALDLAGGGHGQVVAVVGEPGVGKSRLVWEFTHSHGTRAWRVLEAAAVSYGKITTYFPVVALLKNYFQIEPRDGERRIREKLTGKLLSVDRALEPVLPVLCSVLDVPVDDPGWAKLEPSERRRQTLDGLKRLFLRESQIQPLLLVFEDLHWIDSETQALLNSLVESVPTGRLLLLVTYRPEYTHTWGSKTYYQQLRVDVLPVGTAEELLDALIGQDAGLSALKDMLIRRTEANPFFIEEAVRALAEIQLLVGERGAYRLAGPTPSLTLPTTAQAILAARIDRLAPQDKRLLQAAAVVGKDVPFVLLQAIAEEPENQLRAGLAQLQTAEFLYEAQLFPELEYTFKHALTHEVAYRGLLHDRRRALHAKVVKAIEALYRDRRDEQIERLAHHALRAEMWEPALNYSRQAGAKAAARSALADARSWFEQALTILPRLHESPSTLELGFDIRQELRPMLVQLGDVRQARDRLSEAADLAERLNDNRRRGHAWALLANSHVLLGELDEAYECGIRAVTIARAMGDPEIRVLANTYLAQAQYYRGEYGHAAELASENITAQSSVQADASFAHLIPLMVNDRFWLVVSLAQLGRFAAAAEYESDALRLAGLTSQPYAVGMSHGGSATLSLLKGEWTRARSVIEAGLPLVRKASIGLMLPEGLALLAWALAQLGQTGDALDRARESERLVEGLVAKGLIGYLGWTYHCLGRAWLLVGNSSEALRLGKRSVEFSRGRRGYAAHALHLLGDIAVHPERFSTEGGEAHYREALALAEPRNMRPLVAHCHAGLGRLYLRAGREQDAQEHLVTATTMYREMDMRFWLETTETEMGKLR